MTIRRGLLILSVFLLPTVSHGESVHRSPHLEHTEWILGAKVVQFNVWETEKEEAEGEEGAKKKDVTLHGVGGGLFVERSLFRHLLEIELSVSAIALEGDASVPIDLLLKKPFHLGPHFNTYLGTGPALSIDIKDDETKAYGGIAFATGTYYWFDDHLGVDLDIDYTLVFKDDLAHELQISLGPVWRF